MAQSGKSGKRQKPVTTVQLTEEQETTLAELLNSPRFRCLYDKMELNYRIVTKKEALWVELGAEVGGFSSAEIQQAYRSLRTTMVR